MLPISSRRRVELIPAEYDVAQAETALAKAHEQLAALPPVPDAPSPEDPSESAPDDDARKTAETALRTARATVKLIETTLEHRRLAVAALAAKGQLPPVYVLRVPTPEQRARWRKAIMETAGPYPADVALADALEAALVAMQPENLDALQADVVAWREAPDGVLEPALVERINKAVDIAARHDPAVRSILAQRQFWLETQQLEAARSVLIGCEHGPKITLLFDRVSDAGLMDVPDDHQAQIGRKAVELLTLSPALAKN